MVRRPAPVACPPRSCWRLTCATPILPPPRPRSHPRRSLLFSARRSPAAGDLNDYRYECGGTACYLTGLVDIGLVERRLIEGARGNAVVRCFAPPFDGGNMTCSLSRTCSRRRLGLGVHAYACLTMSLAFRRLARDDFCPMRPSPSPWGLPAPASSLQALVVRHTMPLCPPWRCTAHGASPAAHQHAHTTSIWAHLGACTPRTPPHAMARPGCNWPAPGGKKLCSRASFPLSSSSQPGASFLPVARYPETHACRACPPVSCCARASA